MNLHAAPAQRMACAIGLAACAATAGSAALLPWARESIPGGATTDKEFGWMAGTDDLVFNWGPAWLTFLLSVALALTAVGVAGERRSILRYAWAALAGALALGLLGTGRVVASDVESRVGHIAYEAAPSPALMATQAAGAVAFLCAGLALLSLRWRPDSGTVRFSFAFAVLAALPAALYVAGAAVTAGGWESKAALPMLTYYDGYGDLFYVLNGDFRRFLLPLIAIVAVGGSAAAASRGRWQASIAAVVCGVAAAYAVMMLRHGYFEKLGVHSSEHTDFDVLSMKFEVVAIATVLACSGFMAGSVAGAGARRAWRGNSPSARSISTHAVSAGD